MFNQLNLQNKIIVAAFIISLLSVSILSALGYFAYQQRYQDAANEIAQEMQFAVNKELNSKLNIALTNALSISANQELINAVASGNKPKTNEILGKINQTYKALNNSSTKVHIHTPENHSFLRSWKNTNGDSLKDFRFGVQKVIDEKKAIQVLELGRAGLAIRGIVPMFDGQRYIASLEFIVSATSVADEFKKQNRRYLLLLNKEALEISTKATKNTPIGNYVIASNKGFDADAIKMAQTMDWKTLHQRGWITHDGYLITEIESTDMRGKTVGTQIIAEPVDTLETITAAIFSESVKQILTTLVVIVLMVLILIAVLRRSVIKPVQTLQNAFKKVSTEGDFSARVETSNAQDEVNIMAQNFNALMQNLEQIISAISGTMESIKIGQLNSRVNVNANGDLATLKDSVNETAAILDTTMTEFTRVLAEMQKANFSVEMQDLQAKGAFADATSSMQHTIASLQTAVAEINQSVQFMAQSNFSHPVNADLQGDLGTLKNNLNNAQQNLYNGFTSFSNSLTQLSSGDLTTTVDGHYQGQLANLQNIINNSLSNIASMFVEIKVTAEGARANVDEVNKGNSDLNGRTLNQAASLEETAASSEQINATVKNSLQNSFDANQLAQEARQEADEGARVMSQAQEAMVSIREASDKISDITVLIDSIAFQTNLLALNAAVEAARAGEHGRGFAVVAGEVRNLAQKAADAAKEISSLVGDTTQRINHGSELAEKSSEMLSRINEKVSAVSSKMDEITQAANEQSQGMSQINDAIGSIDEITQQNAALVEEITHRTDSASDMVTRLVELANGFKLDTTQLNMDDTIKSGDFTFARVRRAHRGWRSHMSGLLHTGSTDVNETQAVDSHACELGNWIDGDGKQYANYPEYQELVKLHDELHHKIHASLDYVKNNVSELSSEQVKEIEDISNRIVAAINALEKAVD